LPALKSQCHAQKTFWREGEVYWKTEWEKLKIQS
jgi:hypothetical protein